MSPPTTTWRFSTLLAAVVVGVATLLPAVPVSAHDIDQLPFELRFPQETHVTEFSSTFGAHRPSGRPHRGTDLMASKMTQVYAAAAGIVRTIATSRNAGRYIKVDHLGGWTTMYVHLNNDNPGSDDGGSDWSLTIAPGVAEGSWVKAGQLIGWVGDSGNAERTGSHTHFELAFEGTEVDPYQYLVEAHERDLLRYWNLVEAFRPDLILQ